MIFGGEYYKGHVYWDGSGELDILDKSRQSHEFIDNGIIYENVDDEIEWAKHYLFVLKEVKKKLRLVKKQFTKEEIETYKE